MAHTRAQGVRGCQTKQAKPTYMAARLTPDGGAVAIVRGLPEGLSALAFTAKSALGNGRWSSTSASSDTRRTPI